MPEPESPRELRIDGHNVGGLSPTDVALRITEHQHVEGITPRGIGAADYSAAEEGDGGGDLHVHRDLRQARLPFFPFRSGQ